MEKHMKKSVIVCFKPFSDRRSKTTQKQTRVIKPSLFYSEQKTVMVI